MGAENRVGILRVQKHIEETEIKFRKKKKTKNNSKSLPTSKLFFFLLRKHSRHLRQTDLISIVPHGEEKKKEIFFFPVPGGGHTLL